MSNKQNEIEQKVERLSGKLKNYEEYNELIGLKLFSELKSIIDSFRSDAENAKEENHLLRIGIVGQIKRGKSTFLNALFFEGDDILPKAITPMTAALTAIKYAEKPKAVVEYFNKADWQTVVTKAKEYQEIISKDEFADVPEDLKAFNELFEMSASIENIEQYLGKKEEISGFGSIKELTGKLNEYVGAGGTLIPLVKNTEIYVNIDSLKDIEIVDTPGLNDPIASRAMVTKEYMGKCDVIFLLSTCSQFLPFEDMRLLRQNIPSKGISNIALIGSRFDESLLETRGEYCDIVKQIGGLRQKFEEEAERNVRQVEEESASGEKIGGILKSALPPIFVSAMCYNIAKHYEHLSQEEAKNLELLNELHKDFTFDRELLHQLANLKPVEEKLAIFKQNKETILSERFNEILTASDSAFNTQLISIKKNMQNEYDKFKNEDIETIAKKQDKIIRNIESGRKRVDGIFEANIIAAEKNFADLKSDLKGEANRAKRLNAQDGSETHTETIDQGMGFLFWRSISDNRYKTETYTINYKYANVHEAIEQLEDFVINTESILIKAVKEIINIKKFRSDILSNIKDMFDLEDDNFNPADVLIPVENAVNRITIPDINLDVSKHIATVREQFNVSEVRDDEIEPLRAAQAKVVEIIVKDIYREISQIVKNITEKLTDIKNSFIPELTKDMQDTVDKLRIQLKEKELYLKKYEALLKQLSINLS